MIDTHCHLTFPQLRSQLDAVLERAAEAGLTGAITVSTTPDDAREALALARSRPGLWCTAGAHPLHADEGPFDFDALTTVAGDDRCVAWGEIGLDNHYDNPPRTTQLRTLEGALAAIERARGEGLDKPVVLHCRDAFEELIPMLSRSSVPPERFVFHCFTAGEAQMRQLLDFGAWVSFTGVLTYRNAPEVRAAARLAPLDRVMVETDAPFLTPEPHRKIRPNEPRFVVETARCWTQLHNLAWEEACALLTDNAQRFFQLNPSERLGA